jgi:serine/threonine-protein kinase
VIGGRYLASEVIGVGGMGVVYEAEHLELGSQVAVKVLQASKAQSHEAVSRLQHEAKIAGTLGHPNICAVSDMGWLDDGSPYVVMERLRGETLAHRLEREQRVGVAEMIGILSQVLSALGAAHERGVIHRDLKPENVFLAVSGGRIGAKLLDFGISKSEDMEETAADPTGAALAAGTPYYMAPEQARGDSGIDWRVDLWAAGVVLYEGLTGRRPFVARNYNALLVQILSARQQPIHMLDPRLPPELGHVIDRALAKRPDDRFQSAAEFRAALPLARVPRAVSTVPIIYNEPSTDDTDATTVFRRGPRDGSVASAVAEGTPSDPGVGGEASFDDERTVVDTPPFLCEEETQVVPGGDGGAEGKS